MEQDPLPLRALILMCLVKGHRCLRNLILEKVLLPQEQERVLLPHLKGVIAVRQHPKKQTINEILSFER